MRFRSLYTTYDGIDESQWAAAYNFLTANIPARKIKRNSQSQRIKKIGK
jgi:hypothetical protein